MSAAEQQPRTGGPVAGPVAASGKPHLTSVNSQMGSLNDGARTGTTQPKPRRKQLLQRADIAALSERLGERDWAILRSVAAHKFLTTRHLTAFHFADHAPAACERIARRTLSRLRRHRVLGTLERHIGGLGAGSEGLVHYVDVAGDQLLRGRSGRKARRFHQPSRRFVRHQLAIADTHVALLIAHRQQRLELVACGVEPASWRRFTGIGGARLTLKADLSIETATPPGSDFVNPWFIEVDLGNEGIQTLLKKCRDYEAYRRTGIEQEHGGFPLVIWSMTHVDPQTAQRRRLDLADAIDRDRSLPNELFRVVAPDQLVPLLQRGES